MKIQYACGHLTGIKGPERLDGERLSSPTYCPICESVSVSVRCFVCGGSHHRTEVNFTPAGAAGVNCR